MKNWMKNMIFDIAFLGGGRSFRLTERRSGIGNASGMDREKSRIDLFRTRFALVAILMVMGGFSTHAWGENISFTAKYDIESGDTQYGDSIYVTNTFTNSTGIDQISYTYNSISGGEGIIVEYSLDGINYAEWNTKPAANNGSVTDAISATHPARNAVSFRFKAKGAKGWHKIWDLSIRKADDDYDIFPFCVTKVAQSVTDQSLPRDGYVIGGNLVYTDGTNGVRFVLDVKDESGNDISITCNGKNDKAYLSFDCSLNSHKRAILSWTAPANYSIQVTKVTVKARNDGGGTSRCVIGGVVQDISSEVKINESKAQEVTKSKPEGFSNDLLIDFYRNNTTCWYGDCVGTNYIESIKVSYTLIYNANVFGFEVDADSNDEDMGTVTASLSIAPKDSIHATAGATSASTTATYTATVKNSSLYRFQGWYREAELINKVSGDNPYTPTLTNSTTGSILSNTLYARFADKGIPIVECNIADSYEIQHDEIDLQSLWTVEEGAGAVSYSIVDDSFVPSGEDNTGGPETPTPPSLRDDRYLSFGQAGTLRLQMDIAAKGDFGATTAYKDVTITKHVPTFTWYGGTVYYNETKENFCTSNQSVTGITRTSSNEGIATISGATLTTYNKVGTTRITMTQAENYYWAEYTEYRDITPDSLPNQVPLKITSTNFNASFITPNVNSGRFRWENNGVLLGSLDAGITEVEGWDTRSFDIHFVGIPDSISFSYERSVSTATGNTWKVYEKTEDGSWSGAIYDKSEASGSTRLKLNPDSRYVRLECSNNYGSYFRNVKITEFKQFTASESSLNFNTIVKDKDVASKSFKFKHANAGYTVTARSSNSTHYKLSLDSITYSESVVIPNTGGDRMDSSVVYVKYYPSLDDDENDEETHNATITFSDQLNNSTTVSLTGKTVDKLTPTIDWPGTTSFLVGGTIPNGFVAVDDNDATINETWTFVSSDSSVIDIVDGELKAICGGKATITGTIGGDDTDYYETSETQEITVTRNADTFTWSGVNGEDEIHVWAYSDISSSIASVNADTTVTYTSTNSTYLSVTDGTTLRALAPGTVTLTASSLGDCTYERGSDSKTVVVDPCTQHIIWAQSFNDYELDENGTISKEVTLSAYAVDSTDKETKLAITFSLEPEVDFASIDGTTLSLSGEGRTKIVATVAGSTKFAGATLKKTLLVRKYGAVCENDTLYYQGDDSENVSGNDGGPYYKFSLNGWWTETKSREITWPEGGCPAYVTMYYKTEDTDTGDMKIEQYLPGISNWSLVKNVGVAPASTWTYDSLRLDSTATKLRVKIENGKKSHYFRSLTVVRARFIEVREGGTAKSTLVFNDVNVNGTKEKTVRVVHSNINSNIHLTLSDGAPFTLSDADIEGSCDGSGYEDITLTYKPIVAETNGTYTLTLTDGTVTNVITLDATATTEAKEVSSNIKWSETEWTGGTSTAVVVNASDTLTIDEEVTLYSLEIKSGAKVIVAPEGGLKVYAGGISGATPASLVLEVDSTGTVAKGQTGYLRISPDYVGEMPSATVELFNIAHTNDETTTWQYVGAPVVGIGGWDVCTYGKQYIYGWSEEEGDWFDAYGEAIEPFRGYCLTQENNSSGKRFRFAGTLAAPSSTIEPISLSYTSAMADGVKGYHVLANSFAAPIDISQMDPEEDFDNVTATIYLFNTGYYEKGGSSGIVDVDKWEEANAGQYISIPVATANTIRTVEATFPVVIPAMQGFCVQATGADATLKLDYNELVWKADYSKHPNKPMRVAAQKTEEQEETNESDLTDFIKVTLADGEAADILYLLASESYDKSYENGYDAPKMMSDDPALPNIFAVEDDGQFAIDATSDIEGTFIGVRTGAASNYTIYFSHVNAETEWMLLDIQTNKTTRIANEASYSFSAKANSLLTNRFLIVEWNGNAGTATGTDEITIQNKIQKFIYNDQLFILKDGVLYDARGMVVRR